MSLFRSLFCRLSESFALSLRQLFQGGMLIAFAVPHLGPTLGLEDLAQMYPEFLVEVSGRPTSPSEEERRATLGHPALGYEMVAVIDKAAPGVFQTAQRMNVFQLQRAGSDATWNLVRTFTVSTGREVPVRMNVRVPTGPGSYRRELRVLSGHTPTGVWPVRTLEPNRRSFMLNDAPMPFAVGYNPGEGFFIHGTDASGCGTIGRRASSGCTRLCGADAPAFFRMVQGTGLGWGAGFDARSGQLRRGDDQSPEVVRAYRTLVVIMDSSLGRNNHNPQAIWARIPADILRDPRHLWSLFYQPQG